MGRSHGERQILEVSLTGSFAECPLDRMYYSPCQPHTSKHGLPRWNASADGTPPNARAGSACSTRKSGAGKPWARPDTSGWRVRRWRLRRRSGGLRIAIPPPPHPHEPQSVDQNPNCGDEGDSHHGMPLGCPAEPVGRLGVVFGVRVALTIEGPSTAALARTASCRFPSPDRRSASRRPCGLTIRNAPS